MKRLGGAHEDVVAAVFGIQTKLARHLLEIADDVIGLFFRRASGFLCRALDVDAVFVSAGQEISFDAMLTFSARDRVGHDHRVEMTEVRKTVGVIDWCSDVESVHLLRQFSRKGAKRQFIAFLSVPRCAFAWRKFALILSFYRAMASARVRGSERKPPSTAEVTVFASAFLTPRKRHACVLSFDHDHHAERFESFEQCVCDVGRQSLLQL